MDHHAKQPSQPTVSGRTDAHCFAFPNHSDEIVQDLHLFPFYPLALRRPQAEAPVIPYPLVYRVRGLPRPFRVHYITFPQRAQDFS